MGNFVVGDIVRFGCLLNYLVSMIMCISVSDAKACILNQK